MAAHRSPDRIGADLVSVVSLGEHIATHEILENERLIGNELVVPIDRVLSRTTVPNRADVEARTGLPCSVACHRLCDRIASVAIGTSLWLRLIVAPWFK